MNVPGRCLLCMQTSGCMELYFTTAGYFYKTSTSAIEFVSKQPNNVDLYPSLELAYQCMEILNKRHIHSISIALRLCCGCAALQSVSVCFALQFVQSASLHSLSFKFKLVFLVSAGISQSLGFERVTAMSPDHAARVLSACQELEKVV